MTKEEILAKSREENKNRDEMERFAYAKAGQRACAVGGLVCVIVILLEFIFAARVSFSTWAVYLSMTGTMLLTKYLSLKKKHELIFGILQLVFALLFLGAYAVQLAR